MHLEFCEMSGHRRAQGVQASAGEPIITVDSAEVEARTGMTGGPTLVKLQVEGPDGRYARVTVSARLNDRGQVQFELATNKREKTTRARVTVNWSL